MLNNLLKDVVILKPGKENGIVHLDITEYKTSAKHLFSGKCKFWIVENDPAFTRLDSLQQHLWKLKTRNEILEKVYKRVRPKNVRLARAHGTHPKYSKVLFIFPSSDQL